MRKITEIIVHCSATAEGQDFRAADIDRWHRQKGWNGIGYHYVGGVDRNGRPKDTRTDAQRASLRSLVQDLLHRYPGATVHGHSEFARKACPSFDVLELIPLHG